MSTPGEVPFLQGGGEMGALTRAYKWETTPLGPSETWPANLRAIVSTLLNSKFPMLLYWGRDLIQIYNDAFRPSLGTSGKHPRALGQRAEECWPEMWDVVGPPIHNVLDTGVATWNEDQLLPILRNGRLEEAYWTYSFTPVYSESGGVDGVLVVCTETTKQVLACRQLETTKLQFECLVMQAPVAVAVFRGKDLIVELANDAYLPLVDKTREQLIGKSLFETIPQVRESLEPLAQELFRTGKATPPNEIELVIERYGKKETCYFNSVWEPLKDDDGSISGFMAVAHEVTQQVVARKNTELSEQRFEAAVRAVQGIIWTNNASGQMVDDQPGWTSLTGQSKAEYQGYGWANAVHPEDAEPTLDAWNKAVATKSIFEFEHRLRTKEGSWGYFSIKAVPLFDDKGEITQWVGVHTNITQQRESEASLLESEQRFRKLSDQSPMIVFIIEPNEEATISYWNKGWLDYTGQTEEEALGRAWEGIVHPDDVRAVLDIYVPAFEAREPYTIPAIRLKRHDAVYRWHLFKASPSFDARGAFSGYVGVGIDIHNQKLAEEKTQSFIHNAPFPIGIYEGREMRISLANDNIIQVWGKGPDVIGKTFAEVLPELAGSGLYEQLDRVYCNDEPVHIRNQRIDLQIDGKLASSYFNYSFTPLHDAKGQVYGVMNTAADVTDLNLAQQALASSEQQTRSLVMEATVATAVFRGREMRLELANDAMLQLWDKDKSIIGSRLLEFLPELEGQAFPTLLERVFDTGEPYSEEDAAVLLDRRGVEETVYIDFNYKALRDGKGNVSSILVMAAEVTERALAKNQLIQNAENLRNTILRAPIAMSILSGPEHIVSIANERMLELWGRSAAQMLDKPLFEALPEVKDQGFEALLHGVYNTGVAYAAQDVPVTLPRNGKVALAYINFVYEPFRESDQTVSGIFVVAVDVTAQVVARQKIEMVVAERTAELAEANEKLIRSNEELAQYAYVASHDLQEPLRKIRTFSSMLSTSPDDAERNEALQRKISYAAERMTSLIHGLLDFSRLQKTEHGFEQTDLTDIASLVMNDFELAISEKEARIHLGELPVVEAMPLQMNQLFYNLIGNALKFGHPERKPEISIHSSPVKDPTAYISQPTTGVRYHRISVSDNGIGFDPIYTEQIFEVFKRLHTREIYPGSGIGLALCKRIVDNHCGALYADSTPENGSTFYIILPEKLSSKC